MSKKQSVVTYVNGERLVLGTAEKVITTDGEAVNFIIHDAQTAAKLQAENPSVASEDDWVI
jgi:hypothetical protein